MQDDPLLPEDPLSLAPFRTDSDESLISKETFLEKSGNNSAGTDIEEPCDGLVAAHPSDATVYAAEELERILTDLSNNSFRECVARVLGTGAVTEESFEQPEAARRPPPTMEKPTSVDDELFLYDTSSSDEGSNLPPKKRTDISATLGSRDEYIAKLAPWKEIFPPLRVHDRIPQRSLYWISTALKHSARTISGLTN